MNALTWIATAYCTRVPRVRISVALLWLFVAFGFGSNTTTAVAQKGELHVAAAADMQPVLDVAGPIFEKKTGIKLRISYGSSSALAEQIVHGSPMDIFFSADFYFAEKVVAANLTESKTPEPYARGLLVLWAPKNSRFTPLNADVLARHDLKTIAIANPDHAPYGRAAIAVLENMKLEDAVSPHLVQAESVAQAAQFALSGNAELAIISESIAMSPQYRDRGSYVLFPLTIYPEIRQTAVILKSSPHRAEAHRLLDFMLGDEVQSNLPKLGLRSIH